MFITGQPLDQTPFVGGHLGWWCDISLCQVSHVGHQDGPPAWSMSAICQAESNKSGKPAPFHSPVGGPWSERLVVDGLVVLPTSQPLDDATMVARILFSFVPSPLVLSSLEWLSELNEPYETSSAER